MDREDGWLGTRGEAPERKWGQPNPCQTPYDVTDHEVDFIINYDIKYRMGLVADGWEEGQ
ncbi:MAG: hypothetical protein QG577_912 [Thermodesulfobacteriota bacterium]|nr:hypothetical protein [Thermodesulfobacteriota bacterium]